MTTHEPRSPSSRSRSPRARSAPFAVAAILAFAGCRGGTFEKPPIHFVQDMDFQYKLKAQSRSDFSRWTDHRGMRQPVVGTLARGGYLPEGSEPTDYYLPTPEQIFATFDPDGSGTLDRVECENLPFENPDLFAMADRNGDGTLDRQEVTAISKIFTYKTSEGYVADNPLPATRDVLDRGRQRFDIYCAVCHGRSGMGGMVAERWPVPVPDLVAHEDDTTRTRLIGLPFGELFETITNGKGTMPGYAAQIEVQDRWAIAHYLKALQQNFN